MACKRTIVSSVEMWSDYARMFAEHDMGVAVDISDYDALANAIVELYHNPEKLKTMAENAYEYGSENYSSTKSTATLINILERYGQKR